MTTGTGLYLNSLNPLTVSVPLPSIPLSLSIYHSLSPSPSLYLPLSISLSLSPSLSLYLPLSISLSLSLSHSLSGFICFPKPLGLSLLTSVTSFSLLLCYLSLCPHLLFFRPVYSPVTCLRSKNVQGPFFFLLLLLLFSLLSFPSKLKQQK